MSAVVDVGGHRVHGYPVDDQTRCVHWRTEADVLAILFACCATWYPCHDCHEQVAGHPAEAWPRHSGGAHALLCGQCGQTSSIAEYRRTGRCSGCDRLFNPGCARHHGLYFCDAR